MNVVLFGATGMVGQGVLRECLLDPQVHGLLSIGRRDGAGASEAARNRSQGLARRVRDRAGAINDGRRRTGRP